MAVAESGTQHKLLTQQCSCYKVSGLKEPILDFSETSDFKDLYVLGEQLGFGQFGTIRMCTDKLSGEVLACKSIAKERLKTQDDVRSVKLEIKIMIKLSGHPNVVNLKAVYEEDDYVHLVMELCAGGELFHQLEKNGNFSEAQAKNIFRHLMLVVVYCHDNCVVHRDLKPENILLSTKAATSPIKLADFGLATYIKPGQSLYGTVGSPFYIAPEVLAGGYTEAADVWSAGVILYILLSGMPPFWGRTKSKIFDAVRSANLWFPSEHWDQISEPAKDLIKGMLCKDPLKRLTAQQVLDHQWMQEQSPIADDSCEFQAFQSRQLESYGGLSSSAFMARNQDISFGTASHSFCELQSPTFTCRASFYNFLVEPSTPSSMTNQSKESTTDGFTPYVPSMPSFTFFSSGSMVQDISTVNFSVDVARSDVVRTVPEHDASDSKHRNADYKRSGGIGFSSRISGIHNKRNRTIGLGEFEQLDLMVTESVIRWASCTHLPSCPSLQSSLVC